VSSDGAAVIIVVLALAAFVVWIWALVDVVKVPDDSMFKAGNKLVWVLVIVLTGLVGAVIYLIVGHPSPDGRSAPDPLLPRIRACRPRLRPAPSADFASR
jgi:uncharacterized membrane protein